MPQNFKVNQFQIRLSNSIRSILLSVIFISLFAACSTKTVIPENISSQVPATVKNILVVYGLQSDLVSTNLSSLAIREEFNHTQDIKSNLFFEYLDLNRFLDQDFQNQLIALLGEKYKNKSFDLVIIANQLMVKWWHINREKILPDTPVVFFDVENRNLSELQLPPDFTGVSGVVDYVRSVEWYLKTRPLVNEIVIVHGMGPIDLSEINYLPIKLLLQEYSGNLTITDLSNFPLAEIKQRVSSLPQTTLVVYHMMFQDADGNIQQPLRVLKELTAVSSVPTIGAYDQFIGEGIIGGYTYSIDSQAREAVGISLRILRGEKPSDIPVSVNRSNVFIFDQLVLQRYHIPLSSLPPGSIIKNRQFTFWESYRYEIIAALIMGFALVVMVIFLILFSNRLVKTRQTLIRLNSDLEAQVEARVADLRQINSDLEMEITERKQSEAAQRKSEAKYRLLAESMGDVVWTMDLSGKFTYISPSVVHLRGFSADEVMNQPIHEVMTQESQNVVQEDFRKRLQAFVKGEETERVKVYQIDQLHKNGTVIPTEVVTTILTNEDGQPAQILGVSRDITQRKLIEKAEFNQRTIAEALRDSARALNSTLDFNGVLDEIMKNIGRVVPIASANIALLEEQGKLRYSHFFGYVDHKVPEEEVRLVDFSLEKSSIYKTVYETGQPMIIPDTKNDPRWIAFPGSEWIRSYAVMPIRIKNEVVGFLNLDSPTTGLYTSEYVQNLLAFADQAAIAIENAHLYSEVQKLAITDGLTRIFNRRGLFQLGEREVQRSIRFRHFLTAIMFDIDHFKSINDTYGHQTGDRILIEVTKCCQNVIRNVDIITRYGGDEFIILLTETDVESAILVAERIRNAIQNNEVSVEPDENLNAKLIHVTISAGVAAILQDSDDLQNLINRADQALYSAKNAGRNKVKVFGLENS